MRTLCATLVCFAAYLLTGASETVPSAIPFNSDWLYRSGENEDARFPETEDDSWQRLTFPHETAAPSAKTRWYRKHFSLPKPPQHHRVSLQIDGGKGAISVWLNGHYLGTKTGDPQSVKFDLSDRLKFDAEPENVLALKLDTPTSSPRSAWLRIIETSPRP